MHHPHLALALILIASGQMHGQSAAPQPSPAEEITRFSADDMLLDRHWSGSSGSPAQNAAARALYQQWQQSPAAQTAPTAPVQDQIDRVLLGNSLAKWLHDIDRQEATRKELAPWLTFAAKLEELTDATVRGQDTAPDAAAKLLTPLPDQIRKLQDALKSAKAANAKSAKTTIALPSPMQAIKVANRARALKAQLKRWYEGQDAFVPGFAWWTKQPTDAIQQALEAYASFLRNDIAGAKDENTGPLIGDPIGADELRQQLQYQFIPYSPEELIAIAGREFAWCEDRMRESAAAMNLGADWKAALDRVKSRHVQPGEQAALVRAEARQSIDFLRSHNLVTIPENCAQWWGTRMLSASEQKQMPYAAYDGEDIIIAFATNDMQPADKQMSMRGNNRAFMHNVVPHELIPGHHLQSYMAARHRPYRQMFSTPFFVEGWSLYWEMRLWDLGYYPAPEQKIGALFWRMHRCARIIVTLQFHLGQMKPDEMVKFLMDRVGHEKLAATSEVRRYIAGEYEPLYQCAYMLGGMQLMALHKELVGAKKMTDQQFHDTILQQGPIPIELLRAALRDTAPAAQPQWRFAGQSPQ